MDGAGAALTIDRRMPLRPLAVFSLLFLVGAAAAGDKVDDLSAALATDPSFKVRVQAALVLGRLGDRRGVPALIGALHDDNEAVRGMAVQALALIGDERALAALRDARRDPSPGVRNRAAQVLPALEATLAPSPPSIEPPAPPPTEPPALPAAARFFVTHNVEVRGVSPEASRELSGLVEDQLARLPRVAVRLPGGARPERLHAFHLSGWIVDGTVDLKLARARAGSELDCDLRTTIATWPAHSIKATSTVSFAITGVRRLDDPTAIRQCLEAAAGQIATDVSRVLGKG